MQTGIGIDVVDLPGFERQLRDPASFFVTRTFSEAEIRYANAAHDALRTARLGVRYAAREAFLKAWSSLRNERPPALRTFPYHHATVTHDAYGRPQLQLHNALAHAFAEDGGGHITLSLSHDGLTAIASVIITRS